MDDLLDRLTFGASSLFAAPTPAAPAPVGHGHRGHHHAATPTPADDNPFAPFGQALGDVGREFLREGVTGLRDTEGFIDRMHAHRELADRFEVVADDELGHQLPNTVTEDEYDQIVHTYSDIRMGRGDLTVDENFIDTKTDKKGNVHHPQLYEGERADFRNGSLHDIAALMQTRSGRYEVEHLHDNAPQGTHMHTTVVPAMHNNGLMDLRNGYAAPINSAAAQMGPMGPGAGSDVLVRLNSNNNVWDYEAQARHNRWAGQTRSDVLMSHEFGHAMYETAGQEDGARVQASDEATGEEQAGLGRAARHHRRHPSAGMRIDANFDGPEGVVPRAEHQGAALGLYAFQGFGENPYRYERAALGKGHARGAIHGRAHHDEDDANMVARDTYIGHGMRRHR